MRKINYRITVNITQKTMKLGFRAKMPDEMQGKRADRIRIPRPAQEKCFTPAPVFCPNIGAAGTARGFPDGTHSCG